MRNANDLLNHGWIDIRRDALRILDQVLVAVNPQPLCEALIRLEGDVLRIGDLKFPFPGSARAWFLGAGKASHPIAVAVERRLGPRLAGGLLICKEGQEVVLERIDVMHASHPIPSQASVSAAREMLRFATRPKPGDIVIAGITGGSSSLMTLPCEGLSLSDLQALGGILLTCGADIFEINAVRKHLSQVGGGRLAQHFVEGIHLVNLTVSDVIGDGLDYITDPTVADSSTTDDARATLDRYGLWDRVPVSVRDFLQVGGGVRETPKQLPWPADHSIVLLRSASAVDAAARAAQALGYGVLVLSSVFDGESQALGRNFASIAREIACIGRPIPAPCAVIGGGETTVVMPEFLGMGGPNQEFALAGARYLPDQRPIVLLGADTDGTDGPTVVAGGLCDARSLARASELQVDLSEALTSHNVTHALIQLGDAIMTGPTGSNVNDIKLMLIG